MKHEVNIDQFDYAAFCKIERYDDRTRRVLGYLSFRNDGYTEYKKTHKGFFFVSNEELTTACGIGSVHTLNCIVKLLVDEGMILKESGTNHRCNSYKLTNKCTTELAESQRNAVVHTKLHTKPCNELNINAVQECTLDIDIDIEKEIGKEEIQKENKQMKEEIVELTKRVDALTTTVESLKGIFEKLNTTLGSMGGFAPVSALPTVTDTIENDIEGGFAQVSALPTVTVQGYEKDTKRALWEDWNAFADRIKSTGFEEGDGATYQLFARRIAALYKDDTAERGKRLCSIQSQWKKLRADAEHGLLSAINDIPTAPQKTADDIAIEAVKDFRRRWDAYRLRYPMMCDADRRSQYSSMLNEVEALPCVKSFKPEITATLMAEYQELATHNPSNIPSSDEEDGGLPF